MMGSIDKPDIVNIKTQDRLGTVVDIVGFGLSVDDLTEKHRQIIANAELLVGGKRHLELLKRINIPNQKKPDISCETLAITKDIQGVIDIIKDRAGQGRRVVVLASGDPLFHGIGATLINALGRDSVNIYPNISSVAAAFAAVKEPWDDARLVSLHGKDGEDADREIAKIHQFLKPHDYCKGKDVEELHSKTGSIAILTDHTKTPAWIARYLISNKISKTSYDDNLMMYVFENLGADNQQISFYDDIARAAEKNFSSPNVVILKNKDSDSQKLAISCCEKQSESNNQPCRDRAQFQTPLQIYPGMPDNLFCHEKGLITKSEIRAIVLSKLELTADDHIFWDLGAGSGSVSIEVSRFIPRGKIFAVERNGDRISDIKKNMERFGVCGEDRVGEYMMTVIHGELPDAMKHLPDPDRIFIGGGGKNISEIIRRAGERLATDGIMVVNTVLIQTMNMAMDILKEMAFHVKLVQVQVSASKQMPFGDRLDALNPVWIISGKKE